METTFFKSSTSSTITYMEQDACPLYKKHHNIINGIFQTCGADRWDEINIISAEDWEIENHNGNEIDDFGYMIRDLPVYTLFEITDKYPNWKQILPRTINKLHVTIFILVMNDKIYLCETQGYSYLKYMVDVTGIPPIKTLESGLIMGMI